MDEGLPIAYEVLDQGVPVFTSDGAEIGTVDHVVAAEELDIFHGLVIGTEAGRRFVAADQVASLHERGVDLNISVGQAEDLPEPHGAAAVKHVREPGVKPSRWHELLDTITGLPRHQREWRDEE